MTALHWGHAITRPRRGRVDVKFTFDRSSRIARTVMMRSPHPGQRTGDSSAYSASILLSYDGSAGAADSSAASGFGTAAARPFEASADRRTAWRICSDATGLVR